MITKNVPPSMPGTDQINITPDRIVIDCESGRTEFKPMVFNIERHVECEYCEPIACTDENWKAWVPKKGFHYPDKKEYRHKKSLKQKHKLERQRKKKGRK